MPGIKAARRTINRLPARCPFAGVTVIRRCIESQTGDHSEGVTLPCVDGNPSAWAAITVAAKLCRAHRRCDQAGRSQYIRDRSGTIVAAIIKRFVTATVPISLVPKLIGCPDRALYCQWRVLWRRCFAEAKARGLAGHNRSRVWKKIAYC